LRLGVYARVMGALEVWTKACMNSKTQGEVGRALDFWWAQGRPTFEDAPACTSALTEEAAKDESGRYWGFEVRVHSRVGGPGQLPVVEVQATPKGDGDSSGWVPGSLFGCAPAPPHTPVLRRRMTRAVHTRTRRATLSSC